jgi:hemerythrin-like metal-binding protein
MGQWIPWLPAYEINVSVIDEQHRELFRMFNDLLDAMWDGKGKAVIQEKLRFMANYAVSHFSTEEKFMVNYEFPDYPAHKKLHDDFTSGVVDFLKVYEQDGATTDMLVSVVQDLGTWTRDHIRDMDQQIGKYFAAKQREDNLFA